MLRSNPEALWLKFLKCGAWISGKDAIWEPVVNANHQAPPETL